MPGPLDPGRPTEVFERGRPGRDEEVDPAGSTELPADVLVLSARARARAIDICSSATSSSTAISSILRKAQLPGN